MGLFSIFKKKTEKQKLEEQYKVLLQQSFELSKVDRSKSDAKKQEAEELMDQIEKMKEQ